MDEGKTLNFEGVDPTHEIGITKKIFSDTPVTSAAPGGQGGGVGEGLTDYLGNPFDPAIHMSDENGNPIVSHGNIRRKKKSLREKFSEVFSGEKTEKTDFSEEKTTFSREMPKSEQEKKAEDEHRVFEENFRENEHNEIKASAENSADLYFMGLSFGLGIEVLNQRDAFFEPVTQCFYEYERKTGRKIDIPPGMALTMGLGRIAHAIAMKEPECKKRLDAGVEVVRKNVGAFVRSKLPWNNPEEKPEKDAVEVQEEPENKEEIETDDSLS
jgi:hypothetical protein